MSEHERIVEVVEDKLKDLNGYYSLETSEKGVYLTVHPPQGDGKIVAEAAILQELAAREISDIKAGMISKTIAEATGTPVKIADYKAEAAEPEYTILVARDRMSANLSIKKPPRCRPINLQEIMDKLAAAGIVYGIDEAAVQQANERPGSTVICAKGLAAVDGKSSEIKVLFDDANRGRPVEKDNGTVDYKDLNLFTVVKQDDVLAEKIPATSGSPGKDILGTDISPKPGKDLPLPVGKNVRIEENRIIADIAGQALLTNGKVNVVPVIEIKGDVDLSTGNIDFIGSVTIRGSVQSGFSVKAAGDIEVMGAIAGGTVEGKNVLVRTGIQGMNRGYVKALENVTAKFIENATVFAGGEVLVADVILHSRVSAAKKIIVEGRKGLIAGGTVSAGEEIRAKVAGTYMSVSTDLEVGVNPMLREEHQFLRREMKKLNVTLEQAQKALTILKSVDPEKLSPDKREMLLKMTKAQFHLMGQQETHKKRLTEIEAMFDDMRYGKIKIADTVYPGVKVVVGTLVKPIRENMKFVSFYEDDGEIVVGSYR
ncbi:MAG: FapA family protein [Sporomusaceae bacterium]|nr:FapA family protein [Sporomusaceae bacterium]